MSMAIQTSPGQAKALPQVILIRFNANCPLALRVIAGLSQVFLSLLMLRDGIDMAWTMPVEAFGIGVRSFRNGSAMVQRSFHREGQ